MSPARRCAFAVIRRVFEHGAYADRALAAEARELDARDRSLAMQLAYGTVQRRLTLDHVAAGLLGRPLRRLQAPVLASLRLGLYQLLYTSGIPAHAAVGESVELAKAASPGGARLVNAVLRRASREGQDLMADLHDGDPESASILYSVPIWMAEMWWRELGPAVARALMASVNRPAESALRVNTLLSDVDSVRNRLPVPSRRVPGLAEALVLEAGFDAQGSTLWQEGAIMPQSRGSMVVGHVVGPRPREHVLDLCAAPGGKTTHLAALMGDSGLVVAVERHSGRARALERNCRRLGATAVRVQVGDASRWTSRGRFDRVLVDPPCSGLGTLQSRPDLRWRASPESIAELAGLQASILANAAAALRPGGGLTYSVCTISDREGADVVEAFLAEHPHFEVEDLGRRHPEWRHQRRSEFLQLLPQRDGTDGFFMAGLRRQAV